MPSQTRSRRTKEDDACSLSSGIKGEVTYFSPGSYLYAFKLRGKHGYERTVTRRLLYVPNLPLPLIFSEEDARREGYYINRWQGGLELNTHLGDVIELVDPHKGKRDPYGWAMPEPFSNARWMRVEPMNDPGVQLQLKLEHEKELAEAAAREAAFNSQWDEDENWDDDDDAWGWTPSEPGAEPTSPPHSPQPTPGPGDVPLSPSYSPQPSPEPE